MDHDVSTATVVTGPSSRPSSSVELCLSDRTSGSHSITQASNDSEVNRRSDTKSAFDRVVSTRAYRDSETLLHRLFCKLRTLEEANEARDNQEFVKGQTVFALFRSFGLSRGLAARYMRGILVSFNLPHDDTYKVDWAQIIVPAKIFRIVMHCLHFGTAHTRNTATFDARLVLIFHSFANPATSRLGKEQLADLAKVIAGAKQESPQALIDTFYRAFFSQGEPPMDFDDFKSNVLQRKLRGSSQLFRLLRKSHFEDLDNRMLLIAPLIPEIIADTTISKYPIRDADAAASTNVYQGCFLSETVHRLDRCCMLRPIVREYLGNRLEIDGSSRAELERLRQQSDGERVAMVAAGQEVVFTKPPKSDEYGPGNFQIRSDVVRCAWNVFNQLTAPVAVPHNTDISSIRDWRPDVAYLVSTSTKERFAMTLTRTGYAKLVEDLRMLVPVVRAVLLQQPSVVDVSGPTTVFGDIHGNMNELLFLKQHHFSKGIEGSPGTFVFCGDYVDRGCNGVEVVAVLFAMKILAPSKLILLRGNHETRETNQYGTFINECNRKHPGVQGSANELWELINSAFDCLPFGARINKEILCVHGGIPNAVFGTNAFQRLQTLPRPRAFRFSKISDVKHEDYIALDVMWSDPAPVQYEDPTIVPTTERHNGFLMKSQAATLQGKHPQLQLPTPRYCFYTSHAVEQFCRHSGIQQIVRSHQAVRGGMSIRKHARVITIFSDSQDHFMEPTSNADSTACSTAIAWMLVEHTGSKNKIQLYYTPAPKTVSDLCLSYDKYVPIDCDETWKTLEQVRDWDDANNSSIDASSSGPPLFNTRHRSKSL